MHINCSQSRTRALLRLPLFSVVNAGLLLALLLPAGRAHAQGCILARSPEQGGLPTGQGGILQPGHLQLTFGERHQFSYQHYVGDVYQEYRAQQQTQVENRINLLTVNLTYQWTPRISFELDMPVLFASRKTEDSPIKYTSSGLGDTIVGANVWIRNPEHAARNNLSVGLGVLAPSGNDDVQNTVTTTNPTTGVPVNVTAPVDYSIQPGNGGWGMVTQWSGYQIVNKSIIFYSDGDYIATQGDTNGVPRGATLNPAQPLNYFAAISDQYLLEAGVDFPILPEHGLSGTFGPRDEGVPAKNLFPNSNDGFRRPGFAVTLGPGVEYVHGSNLLTAGVFKAVHRDRTVSYPDEVYGSHGDAAFAQYVWLASITHRF